MGLGTEGSQGSGTVPLVAVMLTRVITTPRANRKGNCGLQLVIMYLRFLVSGNIYKAATLTQNVNKTERGWGGDMGTPYFLLSLSVKLKLLYKSPVIKTKNWTPHLELTGQPPILGPSFFCSQSPVTQHARSVQVSKRDQGPASGAEGLSLAPSACAGRP